jgi:hypothetical protein
MADVTRTMSKIRTAREKLAFHGRFAALEQIVNFNGDTYT